MWPKGPTLSERALSTCLFLCLGRQRSPGALVKGLEATRKLGFSVCLGSEVRIGLKSRVSLGSGSRLNLRKELSGARVQVQLLLSTGGGQAVGLLQDTGWASGKGLSLVPALTPQVNSSLHPFQLPPRHLVPAFPVSLSSPAVPTLPRESPGAASVSQSLCVLQPKGWTARCQQEGAGNAKLWQYF